MRGSIGHFNATYKFKQLLDPEIAKYNNSNHVALILKTQVTTNKKHFRS